MMRRVASALLFLLVACGGDASSAIPSDLGGDAPPEVHVSSAAVVPHGDIADVTFALHNAGPETDALVGASCACASSAELRDGKESVDRVPLPSEEMVFFSVKGFHVVLLGLGADLRPGDAVTLELTFATAAPATVEAEIEAAP